ncbi:MAG: PEP-CTERM sorting domain-containing protein [Verrucomicrobiota bacterium]
MKKFLLTIAFVAVAALNSFGQGAINFANFGSDSIGGGHTLNAPIKGVDGVTLLAGSGFSVQLFYGTVGAADNSLTALGSPINFLTGGFSGYFSGGVVQIPGFATGSQIQIQVRAWDNSGGSITSFANALVRGSSTSFVSQNLGDSLTPSTIPVMNNLTSFQLAAVPEPTTIALGVLGGLGLLARRRRNA